MARKHTPIMKTRSYDRLDAIICNCCGRETEIDEVDELNAVVAKNTHHSISTYFDYGSKFDMDAWHFDICEDCLLDFAASFRIAPDGWRGHGKPFSVWKTERQAERLGKINVGEDE